LRIRQGWNGAVYAFSRDRAPVVEAAQAIGKSPRAVRFHQRLGVWFVRCRSGAHRTALLALKQKQGGG